MEPKNGGLEDEFPFQTGVFRFHVKFPGCIWKQTNIPVPINFLESDQMSD